MKVPIVWYDFSSEAYQNDTSDSHIMWSACYKKIPACTHEPESCVGWIGWPESRAKSFKLHPSDPMLVTCKNCGESAVIRDYRRRGMYETILDRKQKHWLNRSNVSDDTWRRHLLCTKGAMEAWSSFVGADRCMSTDKGHEGVYLMFEYRNASQW